MSLLAKRSGFLACLCAAALLAPTSMALAQDDDLDEKKKKEAAEAAENSSGGEAQTATIMVTASRVEADLFELPMTVNVITDQDLKREPVTNITDALATLPGVMLEDVGGAGSKRVSIRGENSSRTLILINGVKTVDKRAGQSAIMVDASNIERIEVIKGPASVLYGPEAIGGVVNIITKKGGNGKPIAFSQNVIVDTSTESVDLQSAIFGDVNGFNYRFTGSGTNVGERKVPGGSADTAGRSNYKNRYYSGQLGYDWDGGSFNLRADQYESSIFYASLDENVDIDITKTNTTRLPKNDRRSLSGTLELRDLNSYLPKLTLTGAYQNSERNMTSDHYTAMGGYIGVLDSDQDQYTFSGVSEWTFGDHYVTAGWDYEFDDVHVKNTQDTLRPPYTYYSSKAHVEQTTMGVFVQDEWSFAEDYKLTLGARQTWLESKFLDSEGPAYDSRIVNSTRKHNKLVGSAGLVYTGFEDLALRAQWSQGNRYPTVQQLFTGAAGMGGSAVSTYPNPDLKPETSNSYEIGARYQGGSWDIDAAVFYSEAKNYITSYQETRGGVRAYYLYNANKAETWGAELSLAYTFESLGLTPYTNATWVHRTFTFKDRKSHKTGVPPLLGRVGLKWQADVNEYQRVFTDLYCNYALKSEDYRFEGAMSTGSTLTERPAWQTLNLVLGIEGGEDHKYNASLRLNNIGNQHYTTARGSADLAEPGFHVVLALGFEY